MILNVSNQTSTIAIRNQLQTLTIADKMYLNRIQQTINAITKRKEVQFELIKEALVNEDF